MLDAERLLARLAALEHRLGLLEDREAIERLQNQYGFYLDNRMWREVGELFADEGASALRMTRTAAPSVKGVGCARSDGARRRFAVG